MELGLFYKHLRHSIVHYLIHSLILLFRIFQTLFIPNRKSWAAEILRDCSPPTMCHMSHFTCNVSYVRCQVSHVRCPVSGVRCLPRLVLSLTEASMYSLIILSVLGRDKGYTFKYSPPRTKIVCISQVESLYGQYKILKNYYANHSLDNQIVN